MRNREKKKTHETHRLGAFRGSWALYFTTNDQLGRPEDLGHRIASQASIVAGVRGGDALDNYGAGMGVNVGYAQPRWCLRVSGIVNGRGGCSGGCSGAEGGGRRARGGNRLAVLRPDDRERRIALLDHAGHLGPQALRQVLLKAKGGYRGRNCTKKREKQVMIVCTCVRMVCVRVGVDARTYTCDPLSWLRR